MIQSKDARKSVQSRMGGWKSASLWCASMAWLLAVLLPLSEVQGQATQTIVSDGGSMTAVVRRQADTAGEPVIVPIGTSALIDLNVAVEKALVGREDVVTVNILSPRQVMLNGATIGRSLIVLSNEAGEQVAMEVIVQPDLKAIQRVIEETIPAAQIVLDAVGATVFVGGRVPDAETASRVMQIAALASPNVQNQMIVAGEQQVLLRCTVAEVSKSATRNLSVHAWASFEDNSPRVNALDITNVVPGVIGPLAGIPGAGGTAFFGNRFLFGSDPGGFQTAISSQSLQMELFVRAMQSNGLLRVLAEPNLVARSGSEAEFLAGGEFPVPVPQGSSGGTTITIEWKDFGVLLQFLPTVIGRNEIRLQMAAEVSEIDFSTAVQTNGFVVPGVNLRHVDTTIEMSAGATLAIAGLLNERVRGSLDRLPGLGEVPVLGSLFRSVEYRRDLTELVVLVTPELVDSMMPDQVPPVPGEYDGHPDDWQLYMMGVLEGDPIDADPSRVSALSTQPEPRYRKYISPPDQMSLHGPWGPSDGDQEVQ